MQLWGYVRSKDNSFPNISLKVRIMNKVLYKRKGKISHIVLNNPERHNAVDDEFIDDLRDCCIGFEKDSKAWVLIISAVGDHFCVGADLFKGAPSVDFAQRALSMLPSAVGVKKPMIAAIKGYCLGGGWMIAQDCDLRVASCDSKIGIPEVKWNFIPPFCAGFTHHHLPPNISLQSILTADVMSGKRAYEICYVNWVVVKEKVMDSAMELAEQICMMLQLELFGRKKIFFEEMAKIGKATSNESLGK